MPESHHLVLVPHTHWDREWHRTHEQFRFRLVELIDRVLDLLESGTGYRHFTLDGQAIVLDDYLEVRPRARERIAKLVASGRLSVGPWTVLPDEWLVSGEALVRNLRLGMARAEEFGGVMQLGYVPDQFGHVGQLPQILAGMGLDAAMLWRGVGADVEETLFDWEAPDGTRLLTVYLARSYSNAANLPVDPEALAGRLRSEIAGLAPQSRIPTLLLMTGTDHALPEAALPQALEAALRRLPGVTAEIGTLTGFVERARREAPADRPLHRGELRSGLKSPLLPGCASARVPQKQQDFENDRWLTRYWEPLAAWLSVLGEGADRDWLDLAWRLVLENHPHDSICGCSVDAVHDQMDTRFARVREIAGCQVDALWSRLARRVSLPEAFAERSDLRAFGVFNPAASGPTPVGVELELDEAETASGCVIDARGVPRPTSTTVLEPARTLLDLPLPRDFAGFVTENAFEEFLGYHVQDLDWEEEGDTLVVTFRLGRSPIPVADLEARRRAMREAVARSDAPRVGFRARTRALARLEFVDDLPGRGLRVYAAQPGVSPAAADLAAQTGDDGSATIENAHWKVRVDADGRVGLEHRSGDELRAMEDALVLVSDGDRGDEYNFDPVEGGEVVARPAAVTVEGASVDGPHATVRWGGHLSVPRALAADRRSRSQERVDLPFRAELRLWSGLDRVDLSLHATNTACDHRLRVHLRCPFAAERLQVESAFELAERPVDPPGPAPGERIPAERPIGTTPQRQWAGVSGGGSTQSVATRGLTEVEAVRGADGGTGSLAVTWWRSVGWLSRSDLVLRPGHAGPPFATPGAQVLGDHRAEISWRWHPEGEAGRLAEAHRFAYPPLARPLPPVGAARADGPALRDGAHLVSVDEPRLAVSAVEPGPDGGLSIRVWNPEAQPLTFGLEVAIPGPAEAERVDLSGRTLPESPGPIGLDSAQLGGLTLGGAQIATWRVRPRAARRS